MADHNESIFTPLSRFLEHFPVGGDAEITALKAHLLIEELLTKIILRAANSDSFVKKARLGFQQKMYLARALSEIPCDTWAWDAAKTLNAVRNTLAHELSDTGTDALRERFVAQVEEAVGEPSPELITAGFGRFHWAAFKLFAALSIPAHFHPTGLRIPTLLAK